MPRAPKTCGQRLCGDPVTTDGRCANHQRPAWGGGRQATRTGSGWAWSKTRSQVLRRDRRTCQTCGAPATQVDHITPIAWGGSDDLTNLVAICADCHRVKTTRESRRTS